MREHGYVEGRSIVLEFRLAKGNYQAIPRLISELVNLPVDVIVTDGGPGPALAARAATQQIPIVMGTSGVNPVELGLVASFARPGGNVTGLTLMQKELSEKRLDLLKSALPDTDAITVLLNPDNAGAEMNFRATEAAARRVGIIRIARFEAATPERLHALRPELISGPLLVLPDAMLWNNRREIVALARRAQVPGVYPEREYAEELEGGGARHNCGARRPNGHMARCTGSRPRPSQEASNRGGLCPSLSRGSASRGIACLLRDCRTARAGAAGRDGACRSERWQACRFARCSRRA